MTHIGSIEAKGSTNETRVPIGRGAAEAGQDQAARDEARKRLQKKREFQAHLVSYVVINAFLVGVWAMTGAGYFWPVWILGGWGIGLVLHAWDLYRRPITEQ